MMYNYEPNIFFKDGIIYTKIKLQERDYFWEGGKRYRDETLLIFSIIYF